MDNKTIEILKNGGWTEKREIDLSSYKLAIENGGYIFTETLNEFLKSFGGLTVKHPHHQVPDVEDHFVIDPILGISETFKETVDEYEIRVGEKLTIIGLAFRGHMVLMMSVSGKIFAGFDETLIKLGDTPQDGLDALCLGIGITGVPQA